MRNWSRWAMYGRRPRCKENLTYLRSVRVQPCIRPVFSRGGSPRAEQIAAAEEAGEPSAVRSLAMYKHRLARSLAALVNILDPNVIVLGGGISNISSLYDGLPELIGQHAFSDGIRTTVVRAAHGDSSGVRGAAWLWLIKKT